MFNPRVCRYPNPGLLVNHKMLGEIIVAGMGTLAMVGGIIHVKRYQYLTNIPRSNIRTVAAGLTEIRGRLQVDEPIIAPLSGTPCAAWYLDITSERYTQKATFFLGEGSTVAVAWGFTRFALEDDTGKIAVIPNGAFITTPWTHAYRYGGSQNPKRFKPFAIDRSLLTEIPLQECFAALSAQRKKNDRELDTFIFEAAVTSGGEYTVLGQVTMINDEIAITRVPGDDNLFLIFDDEESDMRSGTLYGGIALTLIGAAMVVVPVLLLFGLLQQS